MEPQDLMNNSKISDPAIKLKDLLGELFENLNEREKEVLARRYGLEKGEKDTLESIGKDFNITRERIRQIENSSIKKLRRNQNFSEIIKPVKEVLVNTINIHGGMMETGHLVNFLEKQQKEERLKEALYFILGELFNDSIVSLKNNDHFKEGWKLKMVGEEPWIDRMGRMIKILEKKQEPVEESVLFNEYCKCSPETGDLCVCNYQVFYAHLKLASKINQNVFGQWGLSEWNTINPKKINDKIYIVLKRHGKPLHFSEIANLINGTKFDKKMAYPSTVHNELIMDDKYVLVGRGVYALSEWGYKPGVVADVISDILKSEVSLSKEEILEKVLRQRMVGKSTVFLALMNNKKFVKDENGYYKLIS